MFKSWLCNGRLCKRQYCSGGGGSGPEVINHFSCSTRLSTKFQLLIKLKFCLFVFVALRPKSTAMVIAGRSVHLTTLFPGQA